LISVNTIEENIFKKSLQKRELGGLIIEGNFNTEMFYKISMKDILETSYDDLLRPKARNLFEEENLIFHHLDTSAAGFNPDSKAKAIASGEEVPNTLIDLQRQVELDAFRRQFEEAMIRIEDQEDIEAFKEARAEIDDEFDEMEGPQANEGNKGTSIVEKEGDGEIDYAEDVRGEDQREAVQEGPLEEEANKNLIEEGKGPESIEKTPE
jgi:SNF2 family DNA or RNA helicase